MTKRKLREKKRDENRVILCLEMIFLKYIYKNR